MCSLDCVPTHTIAQCLKANPLPWQQDIYTFYLKKNTSIHHKDWAFPKNLTNWVEGKSEIKKKLNVRQ